MSDYLAGRPALQPFFEGSPFALEDYRAKWHELQHRFGRTERGAAASALHPTSTRAAERLRRFVEEGGAMITTGQQTGLFTGPLYTIYKILSAVRLAAALERELEILVLPVFWSASEDHDWEEVNHTFVIDSGGELHRLTVSSPDPRPLPMSERRLGSSVESTLDELSQLLAPSRVGTEYLTLLRDCYRPGVTMAEAFRRTIEALFAPFDLLVTDAADPQLKQQSVPVLTRAVTHWDEHQERFATQAEALLRAGYHIQVAPIPGAANLFLHSAAGRERLHHVRGRWTTRDSRISLDTPEVLRRIGEDPQRFSPNVALRPVVESSVFPTLAYVGGPGEISYFAQLRGLFSACGMRMPLVYPRLSATLLPGHILAVLEELGLEPGDLTAPRHELLTRLVRERIPEAVRDQLAELRTSIVDGYAGLIEASAAVDPTLAGPLGANRNRTLRDLAGSQHKIMRQMKRREPLLRRQVDRASTYLRPANSPQDRVLNIFPFLAEEGADLLHRLARQLPISWHAARASVAPSDQAGE